MTRRELVIRLRRPATLVAFVLLAFGLASRSALAQTASAPLHNSSAAPARPGNDNGQVFKDIYRRFYETYQLGPADEISIHVPGQPEYSLDRVKISPTGRVYHPLLGDFDVAGLTIAQLTNRLTAELSEYLISPKVSVVLLEANSAKIGVLGDVLRPGILVMARPMNVLEAIANAGGIADTGSKSDVNILRQMSDGSTRLVKINVKRILAGQASAAENIALQAGDTIIVHGNSKKRIATLMSFSGFGSFLSFIALGAR